MISLRSTPLARAGPPGLARTRGATRIVVARSTGPHPSLKDVEVIKGKVVEAIQEAEETCTKQGADAAHCAAAWDNVEELSAAAAHKKVAYQDDKVASDPLEALCDEDPSADECRMYED